MKKFTKVLIAMALCVTTLMPVMASAKEFSDMPDNWTTASLERAVENGLLQGDNGKIMPDDNITRAQMAAIIVRAFGASVEADISAYPDVAADKWYYSEFAKAVNMKAFEGSDDGKLNPDSFITFQECFTVIKRVFALDEADVSCLDKFNDAKDVQDWAKPYMAAVVGNGYWDGVDNNLKPKAYITRSEFAVLMDNLVKVYINEPGTYSEFADGNILVRSNGVTIENLETDNLLIIGDAVNEKMNVNNIKSTSRIVVRGGVVKFTGVIHNITTFGKGTIADLEDITTITGRGLYVGSGSTINFGEMGV